MGIFPRPTPYPYTQRVDLQGSRTAEIVAGILRHELPGSS